MEESSRWSGVMHRRNMKFIRISEINTVLLFSYQILLVMNEIRQIFDISGVFLHTLDSFFLHPDLVYTASIIFFLDVVYFSLLLQIHIRGLGLIPL